ncbi:MAG: YicC family protein [Chitinispirillales bacterium]|jgi:uncharacterized protein (TIGR00255 family)|nr:YicC family protein [Chitinispirillales bacterium]
MFSQSMTGYGRFERSFASGKYSVEIKAVNSRFIEIQCRMPRIFNPLELQIRKYIADKLERGSININLSFEAASEETNIDFDEKSFSQYVNLFDKLAKSCQKTADFSDFMRFLTPFTKDIIVSKPKEYSVDELSKEVFEVVENVTDLLIIERKREGDALCEFLLKSLNLIDENLCKIESYAPQRIEKYKNKLNTAIDLLRKDGIDEQRISLEVILTIEKIDITEEITRLKTHISATKNLIENECSIGKRLGFWLQEINREINTIGSKANDAAIAGVVVSMKDTAEQMREQSLNLL